MTCIVGQLYKFKTTEEMIYKYQTKRNHSHKEKSELIKLLLEDRDEMNKMLRLLAEDDQF